MVNGDTCGASFGRSTLESSRHVADFIGRMQIKVPLQGAFKLMGVAPEALSLVQPGASTKGGGMIRSVLLRDLAHELPYRVGRLPLVSLPPPRISYIFTLQLKIGLFTILTGLSIGNMV